jgi:CYTH domain-containing protein
MSLEIERKFLVSGEFRNLAATASNIFQGYISCSPGRTVRVRIRDDRGYLTIKGKSGESGISRYEWEKEIPVNEARELLLLCEPGIIDKTRYIVYSGNHIIEVDEFHGSNEGLIMAEVELSHENEIFEKPSWLGEEVTGDPRYYNASLSVKPYNAW